MKYEFHPEAEIEFYETALRYESEVPSLGLRFGDEVERVIDLLLEHPELGSRIDDSLRHFVLVRFPFSVVYAISAQTIQVIAIAHGSRKPSYWQARVQER